MIHCCHCTSISSYFQAVNRIIIDRHDTRNNGTFTILLGKCSYLIVQKALFLTELSMVGTNIALGSGKILLVVFLLIIWLRALVRCDVTDIVFDAVEVAALGAIDKLHQVLSLGTIRFTGHSIQHATTSETGLLQCDHQIFDIQAQMQAQGL